MISKRLWTRVLGAAVGLIVLLAVPSFAHAHAGHHPSQAHAAASVPVAKADARAIGSGEQVVSFVQSKDQTPAQETAACGGSTCCGNAPCPACASIIGVNNTDLAPLRASAVALPCNGSAATGIGPQDLSRPPKSLV